MSSLNCEGLLCIFQVMASYRKETGVPSFDSVSKEVSFKINKVVHQHFIRLPLFPLFQPLCTAIAGFHCHPIIIKTIQQIKSRIKEIKEDEYSNSLAKVQVCAIFRAEDIRRNV